MNSETLRTIARSRAVAIRDAVRAAEDFRRYVQDAASAGKVLDDGPTFASQTEVLSAADEGHKMWAVYEGDPTDGTVATPTRQWVYSVKIWEGQ